MANQQSSGALELKPTGKIFLGSDQLDLTSGEMTVVNLDTIPAGFVDGVEDTVNHKIIIPQTAIYLITAGLVWSNFVANKRYTITIYNNGFAIGADHRSPATDEALINQCCVQRRLVKNDKLVLKAYQASGVDTVDILSSEEATWMSIQLLRR